MRIFRLSLLITLLVVLAACGSNDEDTTPQPPRQPIETPIYNLRPDVLVAQSGSWVLLPESVDFQERTSLVLTAVYQHTNPAVTGNLSINLYHTTEEAKNDFDARLAEWRADANNKVEPVPTFAQEAYTLNGNQAGIALVDGDGFLWVECVGDGSQSNADLLNLMQIGVDNLRSREPDTPRTGTLGEATLEPPPDATP